MGFTEVMTAVFIVLKLAGGISWSWFFVFLPEIVAIIAYVFIFESAIKESKEMRRKHEEIFLNNWRNKK